MTSTTADDQTNLFVPISRANSLNDELSPYNASANNVNNKCDESTTTALLIDTTGASSSDLMLKNDLTKLNTILLSSIEAPSPAGSIEQFDAVNTPLSADDQVDDSVVK